MKVFILFEGCYSDRLAVAVFSTRDLAERYADESDPDIEEHELDVPSWVPDGYGLYHVFIGPVRLNWNYTAKDETCVTKLISEVFGKPKAPTATLDTNYYGKLVFQDNYVVARDKEHAAKIASEKRAFMMANNLSTLPAEPPAPACESTPAP